MIESQWESLDTPPPSGASSISRPNGRTEWLINSLVGLLAIAGLALGLYPSASQWLSDARQADMVTGYYEELQTAGDAANVAAFDNAVEYNKRMPEVLFTDPYTIEDARHQKGGAWENYLEQLSVNDSEVMGRISIPRIGVSLPILHGTDDDTLMRGAGHLFGTSLPVGGVGTHSVITAHTALPTSKMFNDLIDLDIGDEFSVFAAGRSLTYRVAEVQAVLPEEVEALQAEQGRDLMTLVTCTPHGINSHRLLVQGERVDDAETALAGGDMASDIPHPGFPWWSVWIGLGVIAVGAGVVAVSKYRVASSSLAYGSAGGRSS